MIRNFILAILAIASSAFCSAKNWASDAEWGLITVPVGCMRTAPKYSSELSTQAVLGTPVRLLNEQNGWWEIESPEGYTGWIWGSSLRFLTPDEMEAWRHSKRLVVTDPYEIIVYADSASTSPRQVVTDLVSGSIVEGELVGPASGRIEITLPDQRKGWAPARSFMTIDDWAAQDFNPDVILDQAYAMEGHPYLWGGTSSKATDCSGLVKVSYLRNGYILMRDASQQARTGTQLDPDHWQDYQPADLVFFGNEATGKVTHVGIYDSDSNIIHCAGRVRRNSIDPDSPDYLERKVIRAVRIEGNEGTPGITLARNHPWYFTQN